MATPQRSPRVFRSHSPTTPCGARGARLLPLISVCTPSPASPPPTSRFSRPPEAEERTLGSRLIVGLVVAFAMLIAMQRWRLAVKIALVLLVIEGALRKWIVPGAQDVTYFAKDVILVGAYIGFIRDEARARLSGPSRPLVNALLLLGVLYGLLEVFNPVLPTPMVGVLGWKAYFLYVPLFWVMPAVFRPDY